VKAPHPFTLTGDDEFMFAFHATIVDGKLLAFSHAHWDAFMRQLATFLPKDRSGQETADSLAFKVQGLKAKLTFSTDAGSNTAYGKWDASVHSVAERNRIKAWLLDEEACPTNWAPLLRIRAAHGV